jgi:hypothetical protein
MIAMALGSSSFAVFYLAGSGLAAGAVPGREPVNSDGSADVCFEAHDGLESPDIAPCPKTGQRKFCESD